MKITKSIEGLVFHTIDYQENDLIAYVLTQEYGFMQIYVKGGQKATSKSFYIIKPMNLISFDVSKLDVDHLSTYKSGSNINLIDYTSFNYLQSSAFMLLIELLYKIRDMNHFDKVNFYCIIKIIYQNLSKNNNVLYNINILLYLILQINGLNPQLDQCIHCGASSQIKYYDIQNHGYVCLNCKPSEFNYSDKEMLNYLFHIKEFDFEYQFNNDQIQKQVFEMFNNDLSENLGLIIKASNYIYK